MRIWFNNLPLGRKLVSVLLLVGLTPMLLVSILSYNIAYTQLEAQAFAQMESIRDMKAAGIERYFKQIENQLVTLSESDQIIEAAVQFTTEYANIIADSEYSNDRIAAFKQDLAEYYTNQFGTHYSKANNNETIDALALLNQLSPKAITLQHQYIFSNASPLGSKHQLNAAEGTSPYHATHAAHHPALRNILEKFGYYDIFIIDTNGNIIYSVFKELDFATNLLSQSLRKSPMKKNPRRRSSRQSSRKLMLTSLLLLNLKVVRSPSFRTFQGLTRRRSQSVNIPRPSRARTRSLIPRLMIWWRFPTKSPQRNQVIRKGN